jgi:hypothetical protein
MSLTGAGELADFATALVGKFFGDKTQQEKDQAALAIQSLANEFNLVKAQTDVDLAEAQSSDRLQHWRGALGWVCVLAFGWHYVGLPIFQYVAAVLVQMKEIAGIPMPPDLNDAALQTVLLGMLGLGAMHVTERIKGVS